MPRNEDSYVGATQNFDARIKGRRNELGLTQGDLAKLIGVSKTTVQSYESGNIPKGLNLFRLSRALKCSIDYLLIGEESPYIQKEWISEKPFGMNQEQLAKYHDEIKGTWLEQFVFYKCDSTAICKNEGRSQKNKVVEPKDNLIEMSSFCDKQRALDINHHLMELENLDPEVFRRVESYIKGTLDAIREVAKRKPHYGERRHAQRRVKEDPNLIPNGQDRRSGQDRRKVSNLDASSNRKGGMDLY